MLQGWTATEFHDDYGLTIPWKENGRGLNGMTIKETFQGEDCILGMWVVQPGWEAYQAPKQQKNCKDIVVGRGGENTYISFEYADLMLSDVNV